MKKASRAILWSAFVIYCLMLGYMVFFSRGFRTQYSYAHYLRYFTNFIPFKTVVHYINLYKNGLRALAIFNLLGNFVLFLPMGMFLPCLFKRLDRFWKVILCVFAMVVFVEISQFVLRVGIIDVDDVIFNVVGAMIGYAITKIPIVRKLLQKMYFLSAESVLDK